MTDSLDDPRNIFRVADALIDGQKKIIEAADALAKAVMARSETIECTNPKCGHNFVCKECRDVIDAVAAYENARGCRACKHTGPHDGDAVCSEPGCKCVCVGG